MWTVEELEAYFDEHPDDEKEFISEIERMYSLSGPVEYPEDWAV